MIKAVVFDYGNVMAKFDNGILLRKISESTGRSLPEVNEIIFESGLNEKYETGQVTSDEFFTTISKECGVSMEKIWFIKVFTGIFIPIETTENLVRELKGIYKIALLSNTNEWDYQYEIMKNPVYSLFDSVTLSFQVGAKKPDPRIYQDCLGKLSLKPEECVYVDDIERYVKAASRLGFMAVRYVSHEKLLNSLKELLTS